ncbi:MAG: enoyl-CoA hydratase/isomerase family protein [Desulfobacterales bacterium]|nr:MAG: enoyl-CoA hydratase/isomerase family protein [Desulfobacterales bacterium]
MSDQYLVGEKKHNIYTITLNRPDKRNAINVEMLTGICELVERQAADPDIRAIILKGKGKIFSAGADFNSLGAEVGAFLGEAGAGGSGLRALIYKFQQYLNRLERAEVPIICAIHGRALGLAVELALACDIRLMSEDCIWSMPELKMGVIADVGGTSRLSRLLGPSRAMEILMTGRDYSARQALDWGLINYHHPAEDLIDEAEKMAQDIASTAPLAVGAVKKVIKRGDGVDLMTQLDMEANHNSILLRTADFQEGLTAMMEKRAAKWKKR